MPDSSERPVYGQDYRDYEDRFANGQPPTDDYGEPDTSTVTVPPHARPGDPTLKIEEWVYTSVSSQPPPQLVMETCDRCQDHRHQVKVLFGPVVGAPPGAIQGTGVEGEQHAAEEHYGSHFGELYTQSRCRGTQLRRTKLTWSVSGRSRVSWKVKTIDHVRNGFIWHGPIGSHPCPKPKDPQFWEEPLELEQGLAGGSGQQQRQA